MTHRRQACTPALPLAAGLNSAFAPITLRERLA